jgi:hypothetical protein
MTVIAVTYHPGGKTTNAPGLGRASEARSDTRTFVTWNTAGAQTSTRPLTAEENARMDEAVADQTRDEAKRTVAERAAAALDINAAFLAIASPTNAQTLAQVKALTRQTSGLIRMALNQFDSTDGT